jgi:hypothetical protein
MQKNPSRPVGSKGVVRFLMLLVLAVYPFFGTSDLHFDENGCWSASFIGISSPDTNWAKAESCYSNFAPCTVGLDMSKPDLARFRMETRRAVRNHFGIWPYMPPCE